MFIRLPIMRIIKRALTATWQNKFLWVLGLLSFGFSNYGFINFFFNNPDRFGRLFGIKIFQIETSPNVIMFVLFLASLLLVSVLIYLSSLSRAGIITAADRVYTKKSATLKKSLSAALKYVWLLVSLLIITTAVLFGFAVMLILPPAYLYSVGFFWKAMILGGLALIIFIPFFITVSFTSIIS